MVIDLSNKMERGTEFRMWFYGKDGHQNIFTVRGWLDRAQKYRSLLAHRRKEQVLGAAEPRLREEEAGDFEGREVDEIDEDDELDDVIGRLNDLRQARGGLRRPTSRPRARAEADK